MEKLITVIIPAYNCADTIEAAIESVLNQEVPVEILVLNDQSPDHLDAVMEKYKENEYVCWDFVIDVIKDMLVLSTMN